MAISYSVLDCKNFAWSIDFSVMVQKGKCDLAREKGRQLNPPIHFCKINLLII